MNQQHRAADTPLQFLTDLDKLAHIRAGIYAERAFHSALPIRVNRVALAAYFYF